MILNKRTFTLIFYQRFQGLCSFGYRYVKDISILEDMAQDVFIALWEKKEEFSNEAAIKAFLYTSIRNKCLNHLKHLIVRKNNEEQLIYELESEHFFVLHEIEEEVFSKLINQIDMLPESCRKIMLLALKGMTNNEIAAFLSISENTVKTQKKIAYAKLKTNLSGTLMAILMTF